MHYGEALPFAKAVVFHNDDYFDMRDRHVINYEDQQISYRSWTAPAGG